MNCPNCHNPNPDEARFCSNCGIPLFLECDNCGTKLQPGAKFCHHCGHPVSSSDSIASPVQTNSQAQHTLTGATSLHSPEEVLHRYIPKELLTKLESARSNRMMEGERRVVTILFCDVQGSTQAASQLDPEEWAEIINGAFERMIQPVYRYEGTVARLQGDGLLAFFGAPIAHEDDPERAVLAGLEIIHGIQPYSLSIKSQWGIEINVRVGINTGLVVVGEVGSDLRVEYSALGDAINLAARMEQHAQPNTVLIAEPTYKLIAPLFEVETLENLSIKGHSAPVTVYRPLGRKAQPGSLRGLGGLSAPLIGRKTQLEVLWNALQELSRGRGQVISVIGEAGLGKSRLITEVRKATQANNGNNLEWLEGRVLSYDTAIPFASFVSLFSAYFNLHREENDQIKYQRIAEKLEALMPGRSQEIAPFLASLLGIQVEGDAADRINFLSPPQLRGQIFAQVHSFIEYLLEANPVVLYLDDLHWSDPTSIELLRSLLPVTDNRALMIITAFRPRRQELSWDFHQQVEHDSSHRYQVIYLDPLDGEQARELVANLLEIDDLPEKVRLKILEKSEGNPFFVEEVIRSLLDNQLVVKIDQHWQAVQEINEIRIPDTLIGVITARLDRLDETTRHILQSAAVIGRDFNSMILEKIIETPDLMESRLVELQRRELIREKSHNSARSFTFKHVLTQESAYRSILLSNRREFHRRTAEAIISQSPELAADIARHLIEARKLDQALPYLVQAGDRAARSYATEEAIDFYRQALNIKDTTSNPDLIRQSYEGLGSTLLFANRIPEAMECFQEMLNVAKTTNNISMEISAFNKLASVTALHLGKFQEAEQMLVQVDNLSQTYKIKSSIPETNLIRCLICSFQADFENVVKVMDEVVQVGEELGSKKDIVLGLEHVATSLVYLTEFETAREKAERGIKLSREIGDRREEAWLLSYPLPLIYLHTQKPESAVAALQEGLHIASIIGSQETVAIATYLLSEIARWRGEYELALQYGYQSYNAGLPLESYSPFLLVPTLGLLGSIYQEISPQFSEKIAEFHLHALRLLESPFAAITGGIAWADLGHCAIAIGDLDIAEEVLDKGLNTPNTMNMLERPRHISGVALLEHARGNLNEAVQLAMEALNYAEQHNLQYYVPLTLFILGKMQIACGEITLGLETLNKAQGEAEKYNMRPILWQSHAVAVDVYLKSGNKKSAELEQSKAKAIIREIADDFENQELRDAFLQSALAKIH